MEKNINKVAIKEMVTGVQGKIRSKMNNAENFIADHPEVTGAMIGMGILIVFELYVINAADKVIVELGGWD